MPKTLNPGTSKAPKTKPIRQGKGGSSSIDNRYQAIANSSMNNRQKYKAMKNVEKTQRQAKNRTATNIKAVGQAVAMNSQNIVTPVTAAVTANSERNKDSKPHVTNNYYQYGSSQAENLINNGTDQADIESAQGSDYDSASFTDVTGKYY